MSIHHVNCQATLRPLLYTLLVDTTSEAPLESPGITANGFMITPPGPRRLNLRFSSPTESGLLSAVLRIAETKGVVPEKENREVEQRPSGLFQNLELKKSGPGSKQHELLVASAEDILALDTAKS